MSVADAHADADAVHERQPRVRDDDHDVRGRLSPPGQLGGPPAPSCELAAARYKGQPEDKLAEDTDRDFYMMPGEAKDYGLIDEVIKTKTSHINLGTMPSLD